MVRYYGWYSNKLRGIGNKQGAERVSHKPVAEPGKDIEIIDVSDYQPPRIPSKSWRQLIKKVAACPLFNRGRRTPLPVLAVEGR